MTENEAKILLCQMYLPQFDEKEKQALTMAVEVVEKIKDVKEQNKALNKYLTEYKTKVHKFETIGTFEEFKALKEKNEPKQPIVRQADEKIDILDFCTQKGDVCLCPSCNDYIICADIKHCWNCGQKLDLE